ncbi:hypothetical protein L1049_017573 [Liquidambar formosana]|uniref:Uncharacterized protein n=1 Tax=Liquidambar formosana TaxID=63359 RepID=A0AAP0S127_LIQFO
MELGIGPRKLFLLRSRMMSFDKFPIAGVRNPSYPSPLRSIAVILLNESSRGTVHKIPRKLSPELSHGSILKFQLLRKEVLEIELGSTERIMERRTSTSESRVLE